MKQLFFGSFRIGSWSFPFSFRVQMSNAFHSAGHGVSNGERTIFDTAGLDEFVPDTADIEVARVAALNVEASDHESNGGNPVSGRMLHRSGQLRLGSPFKLLFFGSLITVAALICCMIANPSLFNGSLFIPSSAGVQSTEEAAKPVRDFPIEIIGHEFKWNFRYPGPDGKLGTGDDQISENNELFLPTHCTIRVSLKSDDFIYIFNVAATKMAPSNANANDPAYAGEKVLSEVDSATDPAVISRKQYFLSAQSKMKQQGAAIPKHPSKMILRSLDADQIQLLINPGCGFRLIHDPEMGKIFVTDDYDYSRLLPAAGSIE